MVILEVATKKKREAVIEPVASEDIKRLTIKRYFFKWKDEVGRTDLYKLKLLDDDDIKGVMAVIHHPAESRIQIKLLTASKENVILEKEKGKKVKEYEQIAACFIAFACRIALTNYGVKACVSLLPKTDLKHLYMKKYGMMDAGLQVFLEEQPLNDLIIKYI